MRKAILLILILISSIILIIRLGSKPLIEYLNLQPKAGLLVESNPTADVYINDNPFGKTPFQKEDLVAGEYLIELKGDQVSWRGYVKLSSGTLAVINRDLAQTQAASSGEVITLEEGDGVTVVSTPSQADVEIDGKFMGRTPIRINDISEGDHQFIISHNNFLKRSIRAVLTKGYNLNLKVDLAISEIDFTKIQSEPIESSLRVTVKQTPLGFLRVRSEPSISGAEIARVKSGEVLTLIEENASWVKVRLDDGKEGFVSAQYIEKNN